MSQITLSDWYRIIATSLNIADAMVITCPVLQLLPRDNMWENTPL